MRRVACFVAVAIMSGCFVGSAAAQNLLSNGSFELPQISSETQQAATSWFPENNTGAFFLEHPPTGTAPEVTSGSQYQQFGGYLSQVTTIPVIVGQQYKLSFDYTSFHTGGFGYAQAFANPTSTNDGIDDGAATITLLSEDLNVAALPLSTPVHFDFTFTAGADSAGKFLSVRYLTPPNFYRGLDTVSLTAVPEPSTLGVLALASGALGLCRRRRRAC